jgi:serine phosphatase RsbU (regulator of sigma subunit)
LDSVSDHDQIALNLTKEKLITSISIFASLPAEEIQYLAEALPQRGGEPGTLLIREGQPANFFFILLEGQVEIIKALGTKDERLLAVRKVGSFIGEMGLLSEERLHTASVRARTSIQLLEMTEAEFDALLHRQPSIAYEMIRRLSRRLDESENLTIRDLRRKNRELREAYQELEAAQAQIIEKERMERELEVARGIQSSILPRALPEKPGYDIGALMVPMRAVGGDFYDFISLGEDRLGIAVGDVSDHGVPAALFMSLTVTLLRAEAKRSVSPREVLSRVNQQLLEMNETGMFVTILYGVLDLRTNDLTFVRAGHEMPVIFDSAGEQVKVSQEPGQLMGILEEPDLTEQTLSLPSGGFLVIYTDGVTEAANSQGKMFGTSRLLQVVCDHLADPPRTICDRVLEQVNSFRGLDGPQDDITMVVVHLQ